MSYRDPLQAAHARIAALEELLEAHLRADGAADEPDDDDAAVLRQTRASLADERAELERYAGSEFLAHRGSSTGHSSGTSPQIAPRRSPNR